LRCIYCKLENVCTNCNSDFLQYDLVYFVRCLMLKSVSSSCIACRQRAASFQGSPAGTRQSAINDSLAS